MATTSPPAALPVTETTGDHPPGPAETIAACCTPLARAPLSAEEADKLVTVLKAIAVPTRLRLLSMIYARDGGEACVCELTEPLGLTQPTISHHLKVLVDAGLIGPFPLRWTPDVAARSVGRASYGRDTP